MTKETRSAGGIILADKPGSDAAAEAIDEHPGESCGTCHCGVFPTDNDQGQCHAEPPTALIIPTPPKIQGMLPDSITFSSWPPVGRPQWCAAWQPKRGRVQ